LGERRLGVPQHRRGSPGSPACIATRGLLVAGRRRARGSVAPGLPRRIVRDGTLPGDLLERPGGAAALAPRLTDRRVSPQEDGTHRRAPCVRSLRSVVPEARAPPRPVLGLSRGQRVPLDSALDFYYYLPFQDEPAPPTARASLPQLGRPPRGRGSE